MPNTSISFTAFQGKFHALQIKAGNYHAFGNIIYLKCSSHLVVLYFDRTVNDKFDL